MLRSWRRSSTGYVGQRGSSAPNTTTPAPRPINYDTKKRKRGVSTLVQHVITAVVTAVVYSATLYISNIGITWKDFQPHPVAKMTTGTWMGSMWSPHDTTGTEIPIIVEFLSATEPGCDLTGSAKIGDERYELCGLYDEFNRLKISGFALDQKSWSLWGALLLCGNLISYAGEISIAVERISTVYAVDMELITV